MKFDALEAAKVAAAAPAAPRENMYAGIHKALRAWMCDTLLALGRLDAGDADDVQATGRRVLDLLAMCRSHLMHENHFIHPAMEARAPGTSRRLAGEHDDHQAAIELLEDGVQCLLDAGAARRPAIAAALYSRLALFVSHNFEHMHVEETEHNAVLWAHYSDAELGDIHRALVASIKPPEMLVTMRWMIPALAHAERVALLSGMRAEAPAPAFAAVLDAARPHLAPAEWDKLMRALG